ncbi:dihydrofolate reductase family protein [Nocardia sp. NPDC051756]|uniref:dihydrofolate reductase family protein n=1 Tax=Nocardia sp. NPDC051756 TaxID=3154751 RepID=UPI003441F332
MSCPAWVRLSRGDIIAGQDTVLLGRRTFDAWSVDWPESTMQPFADFVNHTPKLVWSSEPLAREWTATTRVTEPAESVVAELKRETGCDIGIHGSLELARSLLAAHLVDELRLVVAPNLAGRGRRLFVDDGTLQHFELHDSDRSAQCLLLHYRKRD